MPKTSLGKFRIDFVCIVLFAEGIICLQFKECMLTGYLPLMNLYDDAGKNQSIVIITKNSLFFNK